MIYSGIGTYFDGKSSVSKDVNIEFNDARFELNIRTIDQEIVRWKVDQIHFDKYGNVLEVRHTDFPSALLTTTDERLKNHLFLELKKNKKISMYQRMLGMGFSKILLLAIGLFGFMMFSYFVFLPPIAEKSAALLPESFDQEIGLIAMHSMEFGMDIDSAKTQKLNEFASQLKLNNSKPLEFKVVNSDMVNAFALPNGYIVIYSGILDTMKNPEDLTALIGHEVSHVNQRHSIKMMCRNLAGYLVVSLVFSDVNGMMAVIADNAHQLHSLTYSREFEQEADEKGLEILMQNQMNPQGMVHLFETLEKEEMVEIPEILNSHPLTKNRLNNMKEIIKTSDYKVKENSKLDQLFLQLKAD